MGSVVKSLGGAIGGVIKQVAPQILKAVAPAATSILSKITDGFVSKGADFLKTALNKLPLPSPLKGLADKLIGKGADMLKQLGGGLIEKGLNKLTELVTNRLIPGAGNVGVPGIATDARQTQIQQNTPATGSSGSAATGSASAPSGTTGAPAPSATTSGAPTSPPDPKNYGDLQDQNNMQKLLKDQQAYQTNFSAMQNYWSMISNIMKANFDTLKGMSQNLR